MSKNTKYMLQKTASFQWNWNFIVKCNMIMLTDIIYYIGHKCNACEFKI